jgi:SAM-dependent methyltransferase
MSGGVGMEHLETLYARGDDPWDFRGSDYERARFDAILATLPRPRFGEVLEIGCGNGELARRIVARCEAYTGLDAVGAALVAARVAVPEGRFVRDFLPCRLPEGDFDLILLSEILYFLDPDGITDLALQIDARWPEADVVCVNYRGPSGNLLEGEAALALFLATLDDRRTVRTAHLDPAFRVETVSPAMSRKAPAA